MSNETRGSKNLGLIQAIYTGTNPPMNTKIIWYDDNVGQKIHKYYKVETSQWVPFGGSTTISGSYVYMAYASSCDGEDFSLTFDDEIHTKVAIISSATEIPSGQLTPEKFEKRWVTLCYAESGGSTGGNYTYLAFADNCKGDNFALEPTYEVECQDCKTVSNYIPYNPFQIKYYVNPHDGGVDIDIDNGIAPKKIELSLKMDGQDLEVDVEYYIEVQIPSTWNSKFMVRLDADENGGFVIEPDGTNKTFKFLKNNKSSRLILEFFDTVNKKLNDTIFVKVGTSDCIDGGDTVTCLKSRTCWAFLVSDTPIATPDLTPELFENKWFCACCGDGGVSQGEINNLKQLINNLIGKVDEAQAPIDEEIAELVTMINDLKIYVDNEIGDIETLIVNNNQTINQALTDINAAIASILNSIDSMTIDITTLMNFIAEPAFTNTVNAIIANYLTNNPPVSSGDPFNGEITVGSGVLVYNFPTVLPSYFNYYTNNDAGGINVNLPPVGDNVKKRLTIMNGNNQFKLAPKTGEVLFHHGAPISGSIGITEGQVIELYDNGERWTILNIY